MLRKKRDPKVGTGKKPKGSGRRLYTDENPKDTVSIKFATPADARATVAKVKKVNKPYARKIQILTVGEQRAKVMKKTEVVSIFKKAKATIKKVAGKLKKASKAHAGQARALSAISLKKGGTVKKKSKSTVNKAGNYTKPELRKRIFNRIKAGGKGGAPGQWSARKAQMMAKAYKAAGGGYRN